MCLPKKAKSTRDVRRRLARLDHLRQKIQRLLKRRPALGDVASRPRHRCLIWLIKKSSMSCARLTRKQCARKTQRNSCADCESRLFDPYDAFAASRIPRSKVPGATLRKRALRFSETAILIVALLPVKLKPPSIS